MRTQCLGALLHLFQDFTNNYGVRPFAPFNPKWYSWDIVFIIDPIMLGALILGLVASRTYGPDHRGDWIAQAPVSRTDGSDPGPVCVAAVILCATLNIAALSTP